MKSSRGVEVQPYPFVNPGARWGQVYITLLPVKLQYPWYRRLDGLWGQSEQVWKISPPPGFKP